MFHVEHAPIDEAPAFAGQALDQVVGAWINHVDGEHCRERRRAADRLAVDPLFQVPFGERYPDPPTRVASFDLAENCKTPAAARHETSHLPRSKRAAAPEQKHRL